MSRIEQPWFKSLFSNIRELIHPPKLPPLEVTSKPVEVGDIWGAYAAGRNDRGLVSVMIHVGVVGLMLLIFQTPSRAEEAQARDDIYFPAIRPKLPPAAQKAGGGGGGGMRAPTPVSRGEAPKFAPKQFMPPK